jgi:hypothetical protein
MPLPPTVAFTKQAQCVKAFLLPRLGNVRVVKAQENRPPSVLICSIYAGDNHKKFKGCKKVLISTEPRPLRLRGSGFSLVMHCVLDSSGSGSRRVQYVPSYVLSFANRRQHSPADLLSHKTTKGAAVVSKFCAFLYSHEVKLRNQFYDMLNAYKPVDALGKCRSGKRGKGDRFVRATKRATFHDLAVAKYRGYKFVICFENSAHRGYVTEKIVNAMLAGAIPIYWGAPDISQHFNSRAFINVTNLEDAVREVQRIDQDDVAYRAMLAEPWFVGNQLNRFYQRPRVLGRAIRGLGKRAGRAHNMTKRRPGPRLRRRPLTLTVRRRRH